MDYRVATAAEAVADIPDRASLAVRGLDLNGVPVELIRAPRAPHHGPRMVSNNCGVDGRASGCCTPRNETGA